MEFEEAAYPDATGENVSSSSLPLILTRQEARLVVERWLAETRIARDGVQFALPPSKVGLGAGDTVLMDDGQGNARFRIDHVTQGEGQLVTAVRVEPEVYVPGEEDAAPTNLRPFQPPVPVGATFLDLPLMTGSELPHAPYVAVSADPWPGGAVVYGSTSDSGYAEWATIDQPSIVGVTLNTLVAAKPGVWDRGAPLQVVLTGGDLAAASESDVLNGANLAAIGDEATGHWEVFQFAEANLISPDTYELSTRLRGQFGTDALPTQSWPAGSTVVMLNGAAQQVDYGLPARGLDRHYRIGPEGQSYTDPSFEHRVLAFEGVGLRPYAPVHLRAQVVGSDWEVSWVRRTRLDGDSWQSFDVPLSEDSEAYFVRVTQGQSVLREETTSVPSWTYDASKIAADGAAGLVEIEVAQISAQFGLGLTRKVQINV